MFQGIDFEIYDGKEEIEKNLLYDHDPKTLTGNTKAPLKIRDYIKIDGQEWTISVASKESYLTTSQKMLPAIVLVSGLTFSFIFLGLFLYRFRQHIKTYKQSAT